MTFVASWLVARSSQLYENAGLDVIDITPTTKYGRPGNAEWNWITTYFLGVMPQYAKRRPFTPTQAASLRRHWLAAGKKKTSLLSRRSSSTSSAGGADVRLKADATCAR